MNNNIFKDFERQYSLSKTLRFELIPQGRTMEYIQKNGILSEDEKRAADYKVVKKMIDVYHKCFIEKVLKNLELEGLQEYYVLYHSSNKNDKEMKLLEAKLRKQVATCFKQDEEMKILVTAGLMVAKLEQNAKTEEEKSAISSFQKFSTYFINFMKCRENMYSEEEKSTAVAYRVVNQNLPKYIDNMNTFEWVISSELCEKIAIIEKEMADILCNRKVEEYFKLINYQNTVTNKDIEVYNTIIGGRTLANGEKVKGINEYVNEFNQHNSKNKAIRKMPKLKMLYKQILADKETLSFVDEQFDDDQSVVNTVNEVITDIYEQIIRSGAENSIETLMRNISQYNLNGIYLKNGLAITDLSNAVFGDWSLIKRCIEQEYDEVMGYKNKVKNEKYCDTRNTALKKQSSYSLGKLNDLLYRYGDTTSCVEQFYASLAEKDGVNLLDTFMESYKNTEELLHSEYSSKHGLASDKRNVALLKSLLDSVKAIEEFVKPLLGTGVESDKDAAFYGELDIIYQKLRQIVPLYNKVRNYVTRKPYSTEKVKLNFQNPTLLNGWAKGTEITKAGMLFKEGDNYYLGIIAKGYGKCFKEFPMPLNSEDSFEKMEYYQAADPSKDVQNLMVIDGKTVKKNGRKETSGEHVGENLQLEKLKDMYLPKEINEIRKKQSYSVQSNNYNKTDLIKFIDYYKERTKEYYDGFVFEFKESKDYKNFGDFTNDINRQAYQIHLKKISKRYIEELVNSGKLYLFQIYNKDFSPYSTGTPNLHTLYWKMLFDECNLKDVVYKLNGEAEVFFRKASIEQENIVTHIANEKISKKELNAKENGETSIFTYELIKDKRYTVDKFQFHVPITINFGADGKKYLNEKVAETICMNENINVIGIDRGERNLLYISVVSPEGKILYQSSLNEIISKRQGKEDKIVDYHRLLQYREGEMDKARQNWMEINSIKELKEGYLSQAIHVITDLMIQYNAIVVLEDLNFGFMNGRKKVGKQVYQKFEKMLIDKLNFLANKRSQPTEDGGILKGYQLTNQFESFTKLGKQSGFLFYIPAWNTSKIDPTTGFVNLLYPKYTNQEDAKAFIRKFDLVHYNEEMGYFEFTFDYKNFTDKEVGKQSKWTICSYGDRVVNYRNPKKNNEWDSEIVDLTEQIKVHLQEQKIDIYKKNLIEDICQIDNAVFLKKVIDDIKLVLQIRNNVPNTDIDYMLSPVKNAKGKFFDTREYRTDDECYNYFPKDADANGAYNIARKGLWVMDRIRAEGSKAKLAISNKDWLIYAQTHTLV